MNTSDDDRSLKQDIERWSEIIFLTLIKFLGFKTYHHAFQIRDLNLLYMYFKNLFMGFSHLDKLSLPVQYYLPIINFSITIFV